MEEKVSKQHHNFLLRFVCGEVKDRSLFGWRNKVTSSQTGALASKRSEQKPLRHLTYLAHLTQFWAAYSDDE